MTKPNTNRTAVRLAVTTALATLTLAGCSAKVAPPASASAAAAQTAIAKGKGAQAVEHAEAAVLAAPRDAASRALLGAAYVRAGRFVSAATTLGEAIELGDTSPRTIITFALAQVAAGRPDQALATLDHWEGSIDPADLGLAVALAGRPRQGVDILGNALRAGQNTAKVRQNLAYAFALQGDWRSARLMAEQDVPADTVGDRLGHWAQMALPEMFQHRVADLLGTQVAADPGQPVYLALANHPSHAMMVAEAAEVVPPPVAVPFRESGELPALAAAQRTAVALTPASETRPVAGTVHADTVEPAPASLRFVAREMVQSVAPPAARSPERTVVPRVASRLVASAPAVATSAPARSIKPASTGFTMETGDYNVQLGSYFSMSDAQAAWKIFVKRHPELAGAEKIITKANVKGKIYYRVAASGFAKNSAREMCSMVKRGGGGCLAYAADSPLPGTIQSDTRMARR